MSIPTRDDPSLGLLRSLTAGALDPDYELVAQRDHPDAPAVAPHTTKSRATAALLLLLAAVLLVGGALSLKQNRAGATAQRDQLRQRVTDQLSASDVKSSQVQDLRDVVAGLAALAPQTSGDTDLNALESQAAATEVVGPGVRVVLQDSPAAASERGSPDPQLGRVLDVDVQNAVNGLWAAGAEAVSVNGQRLSALSAIRSAGEAILVNYRPLTPPYVVEGIGDPRSLQAQFVGGPAGRSLQAAQSSYGLRVDISKQDRMAMTPAFTSLRSATTPTP